MIRSTEVLRIDLVGVLGAGRACSKPSAPGNHLQAATGCNVARRAGEDGLAFHPRPIECVVTVMAWRPLSDSASVQRSWTLCARAVRSRIQRKIARPPAVIAPQQLLRGIHDVS